MFELVPWIEGVRQHARNLSIAIACVMALTGSTLAAEERTATAIAAWEGIGRVFEVAPGQAFFVGKAAAIGAIEDFLSELKD
jgi:hypothetical protein